LFVFSFFLDAIMERSEHGYGRMRRNPGVSPLRTAVRRIVGMALLWLGFGIVVGYLTAPDQTPIGIAAGVIAGMIVLPPLGAVLGAIGCRWRESLNGGLLGLAACTTLTLIRDRPDAATLAAFGVIVGGLVGATVAVVFRLPRLVLAGVRRLARSDDRVDKPVPV
jgi:hypothetical protein